jgi:hypothetical protein
MRPFKMLIVTLPGATRLAFLLAMLLVPRLAGAECVTLSAAMTTEPDAPLVFSGRVVGLNHVTEYGVRVTFDVDRAWKGDVPKRFDLYVWQLNSEAATFQFQQPYIVFADRMDDRQRQGVGLTAPDPIGFTATSCGAFLAPTRARPDQDASRIIRDLGEGRLVN